MKENTLERATKAISASSVAGLSAALGQTGTCGPGRSPSSVAAPSPRGDQDGWDEASQLVQEDMLSIAASGEGACFFSDMQVGGELEPPVEEEPGFEVASEANAPLMSSSVLALMGRSAAFLHVPWMPAAEPRQSVFRTQAMAPRPQKFPAFPDFVEEVHSSWDRPASGPSVLKQSAPLASLEGVEKLGLAGFPPVDFTIAALVKAPLVGGLSRDPACPNPQCKVTETHSKRAYAAEAQASCLSNTARVLMGYMDGVLREAPLPERVATELRLLSSMLLQISGLQGKALGGSLASLIVACRQLWLSQASS
ncbi:UNVERIFIED_CONTAM: hypothetical protein FKN15_067227 [Acipenser sinensis]